MLQLLYLFSFIFFLIGSKEIPTKLFEVNIIKPNNATYRSETYKSFKIKLFLFLNKFYKTHLMLQLLYLFSLLYCLRDFNFS